MIAKAHPEKQPVSLDARGGLVLPIWLLFPIVYTPYTPAVHWFSAKFWLMDFLFPPGKKMVDNFRGEWYD